MVKGLFLHRVGGSAYEFAVDQAHERAVLVLPYRADAALSGLDLAAVCAHAAFDFTAWELFVKQGLFHTGNYIRIT